jgi:uncharacterized sporulation protein YeaH/YhbH (DUF444 family)
MIVDRRLNGRHRNAVNRERFVRRYKDQLRRAVAEAVGKRSITDLDRGERVDIKRKDIAEPFFHHGPGGDRETVHPGNKEFSAGDRLPKPQGGAGGGGSEAADNGDGEDDFVFVLSREEFLDLFFEDLALPDLVKKRLATIPSTRSVRAGYTQTGVPTNVNIIRSLKSAAARRRALQAPRRGELARAEERFCALEAGGSPPDAVRDAEQEVERLRRRLQSVPFLDTIDLRYNNRAQRPQPTTQAVMFCLLDVSGSMDESRKDIAKRFFALLYLFLSRAYDRIELVFIRHHTQAAEVTEDEFFLSRDTGGTIVSSALTLMDQIIRERYPGDDWNLYGAQASDGDNWLDDSPRCAGLLRDNLLPRLQYFAYVQVAAFDEQGLWREYAKLAAERPHLAMRKIATAADIYPVFRALFARQPTCVPA